jgi:hypothetical protein
MYHSALERKLCTYKYTLSEIRRIRSSLGDPLISWGRLILPTSMLGWDIPPTSIPPFMAGCPTRRRRAIIFFLGWPIYPFCWQDPKHCPIEQNALFAAHYSSRPHSYNIHLRQQNSTSIPLGTIFDCLHFFSYRSGRNGLNRLVCAHMGIK